jgi:preprotein translocase subunit YajC
MRIFKAQKHASGNAINTKYLFTPMRIILIFLVLFIIIGTAACNHQKKQKHIDDLTDNTNVVVTQRLFPTISKITLDDEKLDELTTYINSKLMYNGRAFYEELAYEDHGVRYEYAVNGKYFFVTEIEYGGSGSSYEASTFYIFDTELPELIPVEKIFTNLSEPSFQKLIIEYLSKDDSFERIDKEFLANPWLGQLFYVKNGIGIKWDRGTISANAWSFEIVLPYTVVQNYLTPIGKDVFKREN